MSFDKLLGFIGKLIKNGSHKRGIIASSDTPGRSFLYHTLYIQILYNYSSVVFAYCSCVLMCYIITDVIDLLLDFLFLKELLLGIMGVSFGS